MSETVATLTMEQVLIAKAACKPKDARPPLECVHVTAECLEVTDGHIALRTAPPENMTDDMPGLYAADAWGKVKPAGHRATIRRENGHLLANECEPAKLAVIPAREEDIPYPDMGKVWPKGESVLRFGLVAGTVKKLLASLPPDAVLVFDVPKSSMGNTTLPEDRSEYSIRTGDDGRTVVGALPFTVEGSESGVHGLLMPARIRNPLA
uniref:Uncharacterized protein n=1 Tax=viral metagenome TaxID=1070528 RepID=A0A6H1ZZW8_9ZZZZ